MPEFFSWSHLIEYSKGLKESETLVDLGDYEDLKASHEAITSELAEEDGSLESGLNFGGGTRADTPDTMLIFFYLYTAVAMAHGCPTMHGGIWITDIGL